MSGVLKKILKLAGLSALLSFSLPAQATTLTGLVSVDNTYTAYISTDDSVLGTLIGSGIDWFAPTNLSPTLLTPGVPNYLHIDAIDQGPPFMVIESLALSDASFQFANGTQSLLTNISDWRASPGGASWSAPSGIPEDFGDNTTSPWGPTIGSQFPGAHYIWESSGSEHAFLSTTITPTSVVPLPAALPLFASGLAGLGWISRRRRKARG